MSREGEREREEVGLEKFCSFELLDNRDEKDQSKTLKLFSIIAKMFFQAEIQ